MPDPRTQRRPFNADATLGNDGYLANRNTITKKERRLCRRSDLSRVRKRLELHA